MINSETRRSYENERERERKGTSFSPSPQLQITRSLLKLNWNTTGRPVRPREGGEVNQAPANKFHVLSRTRREGGGEASYYPGGGRSSAFKEIVVQVDFQIVEGGAPVDGGLAARPIRTEMSNTGAPLPSKGAFVDMEFLSCVGVSVITVITAGSSTSQTAEFFRQGLR